MGSTMQAHEIARVLDGIPVMDPLQGAEVTQFIKGNKLSRCLELGFAHGVGTAYLAHAVAELENGKVVTIDLEAARQRDPDIRTVLRMVGVPQGLVDIYFEPTCYTWRMMRFLEQGLRNSFDFIYLDGAHTWAVDGLAFYLGSLLLRPGGWILFDDLKWTLAGSSIAEEPWVKKLPLDERETPQVRKIWDLLVKTDPAFDQLIDNGHWGYARKSTGMTTSRVVVEYHPLINSLIYVGSRLIGRSPHRHGRNAATSEKVHH
jgi:predicted O-methyltransferase YrrM